MTQNAKSASGLKIKSPADAEAAAFELPILNEAWQSRQNAKNRRSKYAFGVSAVITLVWLTAMFTFGLWGRVFGHWPAAVTMVFGSIVAGSTPQGGGAVAFPVFTKLLDVPAEVARTFSLCIQTVGMSTAALSIVLNKRAVEWRTVAVTTISAIIGFAVVVFLAGDGSAPFRPASLPGPYVKITFTIVLIAMAFVVYSGSRVNLREVHRTLPAMNARMLVTLLVIGFLGGVTSGLVGSGTDVFVYLALVVFFTVDTKVGVPTSVVCMAIISVIGFITFGLIDQQLFIELDATGAVSAVGGKAVSMSETAGLVYGAGIGGPPGRFDLFGLWLAAVPVVCWGAPFGSWVASKMSARALVRFVALLALAEVISTALFLDDLRTDMALLLYATIGTAVTVGVLHIVAKNRGQIFQLPSVNFEQSVNAERVDLSTEYHKTARSV